MNLDGSSGIIEIKNDISKTVKVYPNPATDLINISTADNRLLSVQLMDVNGKVISSVIDNGNNHITISPAGLDKGIYLITIQTEKGNITQKVMVQ
jgi:hypothetical protein